MMTRPQTDQFESVAGTENAFPVAIADSGELLIHHGLTKREYFAIQLMAATLNADTSAYHNNLASVELREAAFDAVRAADMLIFALNAQSNAHNSHSQRTELAQVSTPLEHR